MKFQFIKLIIVSTLSLYGSELESRIQQVVNKLPRSTKSSIFIKDISNDLEIFKKNVDVSMIPASNIKLFTTATALKLMGSDSDLTTKLYVDSLETKNGVLKSNIYIKGFGHSTFETKDLDTLVSKILKFGIKTINGNIIADESYFDNIYTRDDWIINERSNVNLPPISALVINKNQYVVTLNSSGNIGSKLTYSIQPECSYIDVDILAKVTNYRSRPRIKSSFENNQFNLVISKGLRKSKYPRRYVVNISNPPLYLSNLLKEKLIKKGIKINGKSVVKETPSTAIEVASVGIKLNELIALINKNSNNFLAECLFKSIGAYYSGIQGNSFYATQAVLSAFGESNTIDEATEIVDGSGISRFNTITTGSIIRLLTKIYYSINYEDFYRSLAISGVDGTLKDRPMSNFIKGNFRGKTGTLNGVTALSGYLTGRNNHTYIVSIIMEYKRGGSYFHKEIEDRILIELLK